MVSDHSLAKKETAKTASVKASVPQAA